MFVEARSLVLRIVGWVIPEWMKSAGLGDRLILSRQLVKTECSSRRGVQLAASFVSCVPLPLFSDPFSTFLPRVLGSRRLAVDVCDRAADNREDIGFLLRCAGALEGISVSNTRLLALSFTHSKTVNVISPFVDGHPEKFKKMKGKTSEFKDCEVCRPFVPRFIRQADQQKYNAASSILPLASQQGHSNASSVVIVSGGGGGCRRRRRRRRRRRGEMKCLKWTLRRTASFPLLPSDNPSDDC